MSPARRYAEMQAAADLLKEAAQFTFRQEHSRVEIRRNITVALSKIDAVCRSCALDLEQAA